MMAFSLFRKVIPLSVLGNCIFLLQELLNLSLFTAHIFVTG